MIEFPQFDWRLTGQQHRYGYALVPTTNDRFVDRVLAIIKYDVKNGAATTHEFAEWLRPDEAFFVPASGAAAEDEGYLLTYVYDRRTDRTSLFILDASNMTAPPIAEVRLPFRVPIGFHGLWVPTAH